LQQSRVFPAFSRDCFLLRRSVYVFRAGHNVQYLI